MAGTPAPRADTRTRLTNAARKLFSAGGYDATSTRAIAEAAGCNVSLIRHYFGSKEGLLAACLVAGITSVGDELDAIARSSLDSVARIERFVDVMVEHFERNRDMLRIVEREIMNKEPILANARPLAAANLEKLASILARARAAGELAPDVDPRTSAVILMGMIKYYFVAYPLTSRVIGTSTPRSRRRLKEQIVRVFLRGVLAAAR